MPLQQRPNATNHDEPAVEYTALQTSRFQQRDLVADDSHSFVTRSSYAPSVVTLDMLDELPVREEDSDDLSLRKSLPNRAWSYLRTRPKWVWYLRFRRLFAWLPGITRHNNSFLCDQMIVATLRILAVLVIRVVLDRFLNLYARIHGFYQDHDTQLCVDYLNESLACFAYCMPINLVLGLPALRLAPCQLFRTCSSSAQTKTDPSSTMTTTTTSTTTTASENQQQQPPQPPRQKKPFHKAFLLTLCELLVMLEIPYLIFNILFVFSAHNNMLKKNYDCWFALETGLYAIFVACQLLGLYAWYLRWKQIVVFHRLHEHLLFQRGFWRGNNRFDFDGASFCDRMASCWTRRRQQVLQVKVRLYAAAKSGNLAQLQEAVDEARRIDGPDFAAKWYDEAKCDFRSWKSRVRVYESCRRNPLHVAVAFRQLDCVRFLVQQANFDVNAYDKLELLHLDLSSMYRRVFNVCLWFAKNTSFSRMQSYVVFGSVGTLLTPLHVAVSLGNHEISSLLIKLGANGNARAWSRDQRFRTPPLFWVVNEECVELLILEANANHLHVPGHGFFLTAYEVARMTGNHSIADRLQLFGGDMALTPLHTAAGKGDTREVKSLLDHGADPNSLGENCVGFFHRTPLHWAAMRGHREVVKLLIKYGAAVDLRDRFGRSALAWAAFFRRIDSIEELLKAGADPNSKDAQGYPILSILGASPFAMASAWDEQNSASRKTPAETNQRFSSPLRAPHADHITASFEKILTLWKDHAGDICMTCDLSGDTPLHHALTRGNEQAAIAFVRHGLSLTAVNHCGKRAIDCATSTSIRYAVKKEAGYRDVMISYCHAHAPFAWKIRNALERAHITTWIDQMDPTGITGGAIWRQEIAHAIENSSMVLCILCEHYPESQWCMKELAYAKVTETPVLAIQCTEVDMSEEMQMYLYTRQIIDFTDAVRPPQQSTGGISSDNADSPCDNAGSDSSHHEREQLAESESKETSNQQTQKCSHDDEHHFESQMQKLLDGIHAELQQQQQQASQASANPKNGSLIYGLSFRHIRQMRESKRRQLARSTIYPDDITGTSVLNNTLLTQTIIEEPSHNMMSSFARVNLVKMTELSDSTPSQRPLHVFIAHGDCHGSFCRKLRKQLLSSTIKMSVVVDSKHSKTANHFLRNCDVCLVVLSAMSVQSSTVADQMAFAEDHMKSVVPIVLSTFELDSAKKYSLSRNLVKTHHFNESFDFEASIKRLIKTVTHFAETTHQYQSEVGAEVPPVDTTGDARTDGNESLAIATGTSNHFNCRRNTRSHSHASAVGCGQSFNQRNHPQTSGSNQTTRTQTSSSGVDGGRGSSGSCPNSVVPMSSPSNNSAQMSDPPDGAFTKRSSRRRFTTSSLFQTAIGAVLGTRTKQETSRAGSFVV